MWAAARGISPIGEGNEPPYPLPEVSGIAFDQEGAQRHSGFCILGRDTGDFYQGCGKVERRRITAGLGGVFISRTFRIVGPCPVKLSSQRENEHVAANSEKGP